MAWKPGQSGNPAGPRRNNGRWRAAIRRAIRANGDLDKVATALVQAGLSGDVSALKEIGDRLDGKAVAYVVGEHTHHSGVVRLPVKAESSEEWLQQSAPTIN